MEQQVCWKPEVYYAGNEKCLIHHEKITGFCFPICPINFIDNSNNCIKPRNKKYLKFYHDGFFKRGAKELLLKKEETA